MTGCILGLVNEYEPFFFSAWRSLVDDEVLLICRLLMTMMIFEPGNVVMESLRDVRDSSCLEVLAVAKIVSGTSSVL